MNGLQLIPFHGDHLAAVEQDGRIFVSVKKACRSIGVDHATQLKKLKGKHWAGVVTLTIPDDQGRPQSHAMIDLDTLPMWLASISITAVDPDIRPKLIRYQQEAKQVLADHFLYKKRTTDAAVIPAPNYMDTGVDLERKMVLFDRCVEFAERYGLKGNQAVLSASRGFRKHVGCDLIQDFGLQLEAPGNERLLTPTEIGQRHHLSPIAVNQRLASLGLQTKVANKWTTTEKGDAYGVLLDVEKWTGNGTPVQQLKWRESVLTFFDGRDN